jgi:hypothetical protein
MINMTHSFNKNHRKKTNTADSFHWRMNISYLIQNSNLKIWTKPSIKSSTKDWMLYKLWIQLLQSISNNLFLIIIIISTKLKKLNYLRSIVIWSALGSLGKQILATASSIRTSKIVIQHSKKIKSLLNKFCSLSPTNSFWPKLTK